MDVVIKESHRDLARKYLLHGPQIEQIWRSLSQKEQESLLREGARNGDVLKHPTDTSLGNVYKIMPEWNLQDLTKSSPDVLLNILRYRATSSLQEQYTGEDDKSRGDHAHVVDMMRHKNLPLVDASKLANCWTFFFNEKRYGQSVKIRSDKRDEVLTSFGPAIRAQVIIPQAIGELVLMRQLNILQALNIVIENILDIRQGPDGLRKRLRKTDSVGVRAMAKLSVHSKPETVDLPALIADCLDIKSNFEDCVDLLITEPIILTHEVQFWFYSRLELVPDERGRVESLLADHRISAAVFDAIHVAFQAVAVWTYISRLLESLHALPLNSARALVLEELSSVCQLEYKRAQTTLKRATSRGTRGGEWFKRVSPMTKDGLARIAVKQDPEFVTRSDPQLHYMLRLCQDKTTYSQAVEWIQKLEDLHRAHPLEKDKLTERELDSLSDLAIIVTFTQTLSSLVNLPPVTNKKQRGLFRPEYLALEDRLSQLRAGIDLGNFAIPINNLLQPGTAAGALKSLDGFVLERMGASTISLYQDLVESCSSSVETHKVEIPKFQTEYITPNIPETLHTNTRRRGEVQAGESTPLRTEVSIPVSDAVGLDCKQSTSTEQSSPSSDVFKVKPSSFAVFSTLMSRSSAARGSVSWSTFASAMTELGFSVLPRFGSIYTFIPPSSMAVQRRLTLHRPHQSDIEGSRLLGYSRRLKRMYGWDETTFITP